MDNKLFNSPAKVNLFLYVTGKRDDGYHNLYTLFYPINIYDEITITSSDTTVLTCNRKYIPTDNTNIVLQTYEILKNEYNLKDNYHIHIDKYIPVGAGLGGGSSNAATFLKAVNEISSLNLSYEEMAKIMARVGSDTVFFLDPKPMIGIERGTTLIDAPILPELYFIIINPKISISTKEIYCHKLLQLTDYKSIKDLGQQLNYDMLIEVMKNDMQLPVESDYIEVKKILDYFKNQSLGHALMSGSGSTVFAVYDSEAIRDKEYLKATKVFNNFYIEKAELATRSV